MRQIIYLGGLGSESDELSSHLRSRREVEGLLGAAGVPVTVLRAGIIVGSGGISWEMTRQLVDHLPAMITPRWVRTKTQPIAVADVVRYLVGVLDEDAATGRVFEIGGPEVLQYVTMLRRVAAIKNRPLLIVPVPLLTPGLSSRWLSLVTDVDTQTGRSLVDSMANEVIVRDDSIRSVVPFEPMGYDEAVRTALAEHELEASSPMTLSHAQAGGGVRARSRGAAADADHACRPRAAPRAARGRPSPATGRRGSLGAGHRPARAVPVHQAGLEGVLRADRRRRGDLDGRRAAVRAAAPRLDPGPRPAPASPGHHSGRHRRRRLRLLLRLRAGRPEIPVLEAAIGRVLTFAEEGSGPLVVATTLANGLGEEVFFRGAMYSALDSDSAPSSPDRRLHPGHRVHAQPALVLAAGVMGTLFSLQRRASGGLQAPVLTHLTWSALMVRYLPAAVPPRTGACREPARGPEATDVVVVGAGLAGLACARALTAAVSTCSCWSRVTRSAAGSAPTTWTATPSTAASRC